MLDNNARSLGIFRKQWLADYYRLKRPDLKGGRESRAEQQQIIPVEIETLGRLYLKDDIRPGVSLQKGICQAISAFAAWQRASRVTLGQCPPGLFSAMRRGWEIDPAP
ncbi:Uncharacterized protein conserved in bacteria [Salmonella enterica subsp. arizonae]|nr:Uncharacterized protein conserved in bacteria [Salmonella enterica subsp. arizonae]